MIGKLPSFFKDPHLLANSAFDEPILLALSGGADSVSLLHLLCELRKNRRFPLYAAHVNHNIRGAEYGNEALRDENFCKKLCESLDVELFVADVDVPALSESSGQSLETAAREARYAFFAERMAKHSIKILATAHNADDNFETQIFNLCRGCGISGICGIPETRTFDGATDGIIVRPILSAAKSEILDFCAENSFEFVTDSTNALDDCVRNKLRLNIIPQLKDIFSSPERAGMRLSTAAREDNDHILSEAKCFLDGQNNGTINVADLCELHPAVAKRVLKLSFECFSSDKLEQIHIESLLSFANSGKNGKISLPGELCGVFENERLHFERENRERIVDPQYEIPLCDSLTYIDGADFAVLISSDTNSPDTVGDGYKIYASAYLNTDRSSLYVRNRREGDKILDGGMHKRIKKLMCDKKVPLCDRDSLPLIFSEDELVYAPICAVNDNAKANKKTFEIKITIYKKI